MTDDLIRRKDALNFEITVEGPREAEEAILRTSQGIMDYIKSIPAASTPTTFMQPIVVDFESIGKAIGEALEKDDIVEVVRCKNCIFSKRFNDVYPDPKLLNEDRWCELYGRKSPDWFCGDGERREDG